METGIRWIGDAAALAGIGICLLAGIVRVLGAFSVAGVSTQAAFLFGVGLMVLACLAKLHLLTRQV